MSTKKYRYPGINYFTEDDSDIFCGRESDIERLYTEISLSDTMVLHAESGVGKSSLVRAGLVPYIAKLDETLVPIVINFGRTKKSSNLGEGVVNSGHEHFLLRVLINTIKEKLYSIDKDEKNTQGFFQRLMNKVAGLDKAKLPYITSKEDNLWYLLKKIEHKGLKLLLIFDQFEEFQDYDTEQQLCLIEALAQLYESRIPPQINNEIDEHLENLFSKEISTKEKEVYNTNIRFLERNLNLKTLFVIREDKLGVMGLLSDYFPNILKNEFRLKALTIEQAKDAIEIPANLGETYFFSPKFSFEEYAITSLLARLEEEKSGYIDPIQLQIVASNIEKKVKKGNTIITKSQIPNIKKVITGFYKSKWKHVKSKSALRITDFYAAREKILNELIVKNNRNLVHEESLRQIPNGLKITDLLEAEGIVKVEQKNGGKFYCLSHDRMLGPAINDKKKIEINRENRKRAKKRTLRSWLVFGALIIGLIALGMIFKNDFKNSIEQNVANENKKEKDLILYTIKKKEILNKELEFTKDSMRLATIDSIVRITNDKIEATIAQVEQSSIPDTEKSISIKSLENLKSPTTTIRYYQRSADGEVVTDVIRRLDTTKYQLSIKESLEIDPDAAGRVNTIYYGQNVSIEKVKELRDKLNEKEEVIKSLKPFEGGGGYELKNNAIEILQETNDKEYHIRMYSHQPNEAVKALLYDFLGEYYQLKVYPDWKKKPSFFSSVPTVLYYNDDTEYEAVHLTNGLNQVLGPKNVEFVYRRGYGLGVSESDKKNTFIIHYVGE